MKKTAIILFAFLLLGNLLPAQNAVEWRNDRTGIYTETGLLKAWPAAGPDLLWSYEGLGEGHSSVTVSEDKIYLTGMTEGKGFLFVFDLSGKLLAKKEYAEEWDASYSGTRGSVVPNAGKLYVVSGTGEVVCFNQNDLSLAWKKSYTKDYAGQIPKYGVNESPLIVGEKLILTPGGAEHNIIAVNKNDGKLIWSSAAKGDISSYCSPIFLADQQVPQVVTITGNHVVGIDVANGKMLWSFPFTNRFMEHPNTPVYGGDNLLLCNSSYKVGSVMLRLTNGGRAVEQVWTAPQLDVRTGHMLKLGSYAYGAGDYKKGWYCVDWKTGKLQYEDRSLPAGAIIAADGMLYCYADNGTLALVRATPEKFDVVSKFSITKGTNQHWAHPVIYKGVLYLRHGNALMAYKIK
ncbi:MAG: PQQ-binding-like beta-propeller repeat protein [Prevotellaceae bacterium]|nr:PQQ-binding-like beta-propeller repeat protein [Prevotellaceae bacterium]